MSTSTTVHLTATYTSPRSSDPQTLSSTPLSLPLPPNPSTPLSVSDKTAYLSSLRSATIALQDRINTDLTVRMEEDVAAAAATAQDSGSATKTTAKSNEIDEEENYGEEQVSGDDE
ncbi:hypothetical protein F5B22DRAFT_647019 [Xylaria bambusicola]|uniref:uncharacterized protein n=1 Tax=Xylaria bambusicola TaxID=326684 RepID=UPI0020075301|nr:uncharacterized protein F5B22DRAFT_647019 [Xylaria bambusicola]KAI0515140.1 hypothetical protein F5B22DRAFT_647019 [Xylaria bambusicola]